MEEAPKQRGRGRKKKPPGTALERDWRVRVTAALDDLMREVAGEGEASQYVREAVRQRLEREGHAGV